MLTLFGNLESGNVHKVQIILRMINRLYRLVDVKQTSGQPRDPRFLALNVMGKVPAVLFENGTVMSESGALLFLFAQGTPFWPQGTPSQTEVLRWMFFEQYNHEPALAVMRYLRCFADAPHAHADRIAQLAPKARFALDVMEARLATTAWVAGTIPTIADIALYPYTRWAPQSGLDVAGWPSVLRWLTCVEALPHFLPLGVSGASEHLSFEDHFGAMA